MSPNTNNPHDIAAQPLGIKDMMAHVQSHRKPEISVSGSGSILPEGLGMIGPAESEKMANCHGCTDGLSDQKVAKTDHVVGDEAVIRAQASPRRTSNATCRSRKRKIDQVASSGDNSDKENMMPLTCPAPAMKRICREKTGTEWQSVLDIVKFSEELKGRKQNEAVTKEGKQ
ncbi:hypothetical protein EDD22DRAFT_854095 [Suillus occidentalis]|nr:hypothetical protein EDD22DRAFT_854095 [Suillus occidentalis]